MPLRPEFPRPIRADRIGPEGRTEHLVASPAERSALARRFGIGSVDRLEAEVTLRPAPGGQIVVRGRLSATVVQECVVSFEPVTQQVEERVDLRFVPAEAVGAPGEEDPDSPDVVPMEPGAVLDLGEALAQQLALALDPYPRAEGATLPADLAPPEDEPERAPAGKVKPFAALARLRPKRDEG